MVDSTHSYSDAHSYYCTHCRLYIYEGTPKRLAERVNNHNNLQHPFDWSNWTEGGIVLSAQYRHIGAHEHAPEAARRVLSQYTEPFGTTSRREWGDAKNVPTITDADRRLLAQGLVKW